ncbi:ligand-gated channel [Methylocystis bryophila]|uniref:Ligand-gated channel n=1 Tax=Methylocystis bryophila TaxID=655015 RepID=A0A1W6N1Q4_9HYPH|nr:ligand-gated channel [Methylocystis bryophila]
MSQKPRKQARLRPQQPARPTTTATRHAAPLPILRAAAAVPGPPTQALGPTTAQPSAELTNAARLDRLLPKIGASQYSLDRAAIEALPQGNEAPLDKVLLQAPGVTQDSAASGGLHVRNEHANLQYRINGILLPDGVSGFGQVLDTGFIGSLSLITGALPAQYGLRTAGLIDIVSRPPPETPGGNLTLYGGSHATGQTFFEYGAKSGPWEVFATGRLVRNNLGLENPTPSHEAIHDLTQQGRFFGYAAYAIDDTTKLSYITGTSIANFHIPNNPNQPPNFEAFGVGWFDSSKLNEIQDERNFYNVIALTHSAGPVDAQLSYFSRYSTLHYVPDQIGDLVFNGVASDVYRASLVNGLQGDAAYRVNDAHTFRAGFITSGEKTHVVTNSSLEPLDANGVPIDQPYGVYDSNAKVGWIAGVYAQDEWKLSDRLTLNGGLRFDQIWQFVDADQVSPRFGLVFKPLDGTTLHAGYARNFTPPPQALAAPTSLVLYNNTTLQPAIPYSGPVRPERAHVFDVGATQKVGRELEVGLDFYYKRARNLLDDGQFGQAYALTAFNYDRAYNTGVELSSKFESGGLRAYANLAWGRQRATQWTSNQFLFGPDEYSYVANHYIYTDHAQTWTGSAGASYVFWGTRGSIDMIYGSGLRSGFANTTHVSPYAQVNLSLSREIGVVFDKPLTLRFDIVNLFDHAYELRDGSGIGVFAPQYGPRRGFFVALKQAF